MLEGTAREAEALLRTEAAEKDVAIRVSGDEGEALIPYDRLKELLLNLMENAIRYGKAQGHVDVTVEQGKGSMVITVRDDGIGIPREALPHIFERFYRVDKSRSKQTGGTGLGLSIAKHLVECHQGSISLESTLGEGSAFTVTLPEAG